MAGDGEKLQIQPSHNAKLQFKNHYTLASSDYPGMTPTGKPFNGDNYTNWSNSARLGLGAKLKLGFVDGTLPRPSDDSPDLQSWMTCNFMVRCWLLNSLTPEIAECFMFTNSAKELWDELGEHFGEANGPQIYQLHRDLTLLMQNNDLVSVYFSKMKKIWDELQNLNGMPKCSCGFLNKCTCNLSKKLQDKDSRTMLIQFLMGLNSSYNGLRNQILAMEPRPSINRAYSIIQQAERQRQITEAMSTPEAYAAQKQLPGKMGFRRGKVDEQDKYCVHCKIRGHSSEQHLKIIGYPEWYKQKYGQKLAAQATTHSARGILGNPLQITPDPELNHSKGIVTTVCQEVLKALKAQQSLSPENPEQSSPPGPYF